MIALKPDKQAYRRGWLPLIVAGAVFAVVVSVIAGVRADPESTSDFDDFWRTALHLRQTGEISDEFGVHNYLPFFTVFMTPWSLLPVRVAAALFTLLSLGLFGLTVALAEALLNDGFGPRPRKATLVAIGLMLAYVVSCGVLGQVGLLLLFLIVATWFLVERGKEWTAGGALGLAALIKLLPAALIVFFLLTRRWRVAGVAIGVFVIFGFGLPLVTVGFEETVAQHREFRVSALKDHAARTSILREKPKKANYSNNALPVTLRRLLSPVNGDASDSDPERRLFVNVVDLPREAIWWVYVALMAGLVVTSAGIAVRGPRPWPPGDPETGRSLRAQYGAWCCLMLLASPLLWTHYLPLAYWPLALAADRAERVEREQKRPCWSCAMGLWVWLVCAGLLAWPAARAAGAQLFSVAVLWGVMVSMGWGHASGSAKTQ